MKTELYDPCLAVGLLAEQARLIEELRVGLTRRNVSATLLEKIVRHQARVKLPKVWSLYVGGAKVSEGTVDEGVTLTVVAAKERK